MSEKEKEKETDSDVDTGTGANAVAAPLPVDTEAPQAPAAPAAMPPSAAPAVAQDMDAESPAEVEPPDTGALPEQAPQPAEPIPPKPTPGLETVGSGNTVDVVGRLPPEQNAMQKNAEAMAFGDDLHNGQIQPKTYRDLFSKNHDGSEKSTLGKLGTIFGLLVSGAGSGLAHQPNALMDMMNREIDRDLDAQKASQANKLNWYNTAMAHEKAMAEMELNNAHANAVNTGAWGKAEESSFQHWKNKQLPGYLEDNATTEAKNRMHMANIQMRQEDVNRMPPGTAKTAGQNYIDTVMKPKTLQIIQQNNLGNAQRNALRQAQNPNPLKDKGEIKDPRAPVVDQDALNKKIQLGMIAPGAAGSIPEGQVGVVNQEVKNLSLNRKYYADYVDNFRKLDELNFAGQVPAAGAASSLLSGIGSAVGGALAGPLGIVGGGGLGNAAGHAANDLKSAFEVQRNSLIESLKQRIGKDMNADERDKLINSLVPTWNDTDESRSEKFQQGTLHFKGNAGEETPALRAYGLRSTGSDFPVQPYKPSKKADRARPMDTDTSTEKG